MDFYTNLGSILNITTNESRHLIQMYNTANLEFFERIFTSLPVANPSMYIDNKDSVVFTNALGEPYIYKIARDEGSDRYEYLKELFKEIIIQTLLQSDSKYGHYVCKIYSVYRSGSNCILKLEAVEHTISEVFDVIHTKEVERIARSSIPSGMPKMKHAMALAAFMANARRKAVATVIPAERSLRLRDILVKVIEMLSHFHNKYKFVHNDLHTENIMITGNADMVENIRLIDFGLSYVQIDGINIGNDSLNQDIKKLMFNSMQIGYITKTFKTLLNKIYKTDDLTYTLCIDMLSSEPITNAVGGKHYTRTKKTKKRMSRRS
jgi:serine/threonine protein kinase